MKSNKNNQLELGPQQMLEMFPELGRVEVSDDAVGRIMTKDQGLYPPPSRQPICHDTEERNFIHFYIEAWSAGLILNISRVHFPSSIQSKQALVPSIADSY